MPVKPLPPDPSLDHLKYQAKDLIESHSARDPQAAQRIREFHPRFHRSSDAEIFDTRLSLSDAQLTIARERGFASWARLKRHLENPSAPREDPAFRRAVDLLDAGDVDTLRTHLDAHPNLVHQRMQYEGRNYFRNPALLEFIAENPVRRGTLPANIVELTKLILDAGAATDQSAMNSALALVCSGRVPRECRVQIQLIRLLCEYGADPDSAITSALAHGEFQAVDSLLANGARIDLRVTAALGRLEESERLLPAAGPEARHQALALASQFGRTEIIRMLLDVGEDPNRYNPVGFHSHSTPLHQAAAGGHAAAVRLLVERGARLDARDTLWQSTPADWAKHEGQTAIEKYLDNQHPTTQASQDGD